MKLKMNFNNNKVFGNRKLYLYCMVYLLCSSSAVFATQYAISVSNNQFSPNIVYAFVGDTIVWNWVDGTHTTTSTAVPVGANTWNVPMTSASTTFQYVVKVAGNYDYLCVPHAPGMAGQIVVHIALGIKQEQEKSFKMSTYSTENSLSVSLTSAVAAHGQMAVYDLLGRAINKEKIEVSNGENQYMFDTRNLQRGIYFIKAEMEGIEIPTVKFIVE